MSGQLRRKCLFGSVASERGEPTMGRTGWDPAISTRQSGKSENLEDRISNFSLKLQSAEKSDKAGNPQGAP